jgi:putative NIF3 family GTP cyclohydrolase 1 type 2
VKYNGFWDAKDLGMTIIDAGHYHTENPVAKAVAQKLSEKFPKLEVFVSDPLCPFYTF